MFRAKWVTETKEKFCMYLLILKFLEAASSIPYEYD